MLPCDAFGNCRGCGRPCSTGGCFNLRCPARWFVNYALPWTTLVQPVTYLEKSHPDTTMPQVRGR